MRRSSKHTLQQASESVCDGCRSRIRSAKILAARRSFTSACHLRGSPRTSILPDRPARTRFAPSPTGDLHLGSVRTALFNYLLARRTGGQFLLRIEDTDQKRTVPGAEQRLFDDLRWAGLNWDEGPVVGGPYGPYRQSERLYLYDTHIQTLLQNGKAYRCFCSLGRLAELNDIRHKNGQPLGYDRKCIDIPVAEAENRAAQGQVHTVRFRAPKEYPKYVDLVFGKTGHGEVKSKQHQYDTPVYDDPILIKSDGFPTYHFANVVDDRLMQISHVIRGSEWLSSTPLHVALYEAFDWSPPLYAHVPLLVDVNKQKLSKRNADIDLASYRRDQIFPEALTNFAALLGWSHQHKSDVFDLEELAQVFDLKITRGNTIVASEKLDFLQEQHGRRRVARQSEDFEQIVRDVAVALLERYGAAKVKDFLVSRRLEDVIKSMLLTPSLSFCNAVSFVDSLDVFFAQPVRPPLKDIVQDTANLSSLRIAAMTLLLTPSEAWTRETHRLNLSHLSLSVTDTPSPEQIKAEKRDLYAFLRWALLFGAKGPSIPDTMEILGKEACEKRIKDAVLLVREYENKTSKPSLLSQEAGVAMLRHERGMKKWSEHKLASRENV